MRTSHGGLVWASEIQVCFNELHGAKEVSTWQVAVAKAAWLARLPLPTVSWATLSCWVLVTSSQLAGPI